MIEVRGIHPIEASEPVHIVDCAVAGSFEDVDWGSVTQPQPGTPQSEWQAPYEEQQIGTLPDGRVRAVFFFHYLDPELPLESVYGPLSLPPVSLLPDELSGIEYVEP